MCLCFIACIIVILYLACLPAGSGVPRVSEPKTASMQGYLLTFIITYQTL